MRVDPQRRPVRTLKVGPGDDGRTRQPVPERAMNPTESTPATVRESARRGDPGVFGQAVLRLLTHETTVDAVHVLSPHFRLVSLRSDAFRRLAHVPGDKVQVRVG